MNKIVKVAVIIGAIVVGGFLFYKYRVAHKIVLTDIELTDLDGKKVSLSDFKDKNLFINFFATWCGPCVGEMQELNKAQEVLSKEGFVFICISDEPVEQLKNFKETFAGNILVLHSEKKLDHLKVYTFPTSYIFKPDGCIAYKKIGVEDWKSDKVINKLRGVVK